MEGLFEVFFSGRELKGLSPRSSGSSSWAASGAGVEAFEENRINDQVMGYMSAPDDGTQPPTATELQSLPGGGAYDALLEPGRSEDLLAAMPEIFRNDPPVRCGANAELVGLSCAFGERYAQQAFSPAAVARIFQLAGRFWNPGPAGNVQRLPITTGSQLFIVGDTHGQLEDVLWLFFKYGKPSATNQYLFNGDIVDRGGHSLEILLLLMAIKRDIPNSIHLQRGNHEDVQCGIHFGFRTEMQSKFGCQAGGLLWNLCGNVVFPLMPLLAVVDGILTGGRRFAVLHGGVPVDCPGQTGPIRIDEDIMRIDRGRQTLQATHDFFSHVMFNMLWSDPAETMEGKRTNNHGRGNRFLPEDTVAFCSKNEIAFVVRSHEVPRNLRGAVAAHGSKIFTVFSASNYMGSTGNKGGVFFCEVGKGLSLKEHWAPEWPDLSRFFAQHFKTKNATERFAIAEEYEKFGTGAGDAACASPRTTLPVPPAARQQQEERDARFVMERICENKDQLFNQFRSLDDNFSGRIPKDKWVGAMLAQLQPVSDCITPALLDKLHAYWGLSDPVGYVRFLHRFQIRGPDQSDGAPDLMREVSRLRRQLIDAPSQSLERLLDPDGDRTVSQQEFIHFLPQFNIDVPPQHAGALYETMCAFCRQDPLTLDSTVLCLSIMSRDPPPVNQWSPIAEQIGAEILKYRQTYAGAFRIWDTDRDGFLQLEELEQGLQQLPATKHIDRNTIVNFMDYMEGMGVTNRRVSMFEFVRAVAPRTLALELHSSMLKELLKRVWICRPALQTLLAQYDRRAANTVSVSEFRLCLEEINNQLEQRGRPVLSDAQVASICEIAACGSRTIKYDRFISGLHVIDLGRS